MSSSIRIFSSELGLLGTRGFIVSREGEPGALLVDFPDGVASWVAEIEQRENLRIEGMVLTHGHWDHLAGYGELEALFDARGEAMPPLFAHIADGLFIDNPKSMSAFAPASLELKAPCVSTWWDNLPIHWNFLGVDWEIRHVPGHAPGNILLYSREARVAIVGDVIFKESVGRYDLPLSNWKDLQESILTQVYTLPDETVLMPGHGANTTVKHEKKHNPYVPERAH